jgi:hypothetical protein
LTGLHALVFLAVAVFQGTAVSASSAQFRAGSICDGAEPLAGARAGEAGAVEFQRTHMLPEPKHDRGNPPGIEAVSFDPDVLFAGTESGLGRVTSLGFDSRVERIFCIQYRPEMLGLVLRNGDRRLPSASLRAEVIGNGCQNTLLGDLPPFHPNGTVRILLQASSSLAEAEEIRLRILPSDQGNRSR